MGGAFFVRLLLSALQITGEISIVVLMRTNHYQFELVTDATIGEQILRCVYVELVNEDAPQIPFLFLAYGRVFDDRADLVVENPLLLLSESADPFLE